MANCSSLVNVTGNWTNCTLNKLATETVDDHHVYIVCTIIFCVLVIIVGALGNSCVIVAFISQFARLKTCEIFMVGLAVADLVGTIIVPLNLVLELRGYDFSNIGDFGCAFLSWLSTTCITVSAFYLAAIAVDRFIIVLWPLKARISHWKALLATIGIWIIGSPAAVIYFFHGIVRVDVGENGRGVCRTFWRSTTEDYVFTISLFMVQMIIPIALMTILYSWIVIELRSHRDADLNDNRARSIEIRNRRNKKAIRLFLTIVFVFYMLVLPYNVFYLVYTLQSIPYSNLLFYTLGILGLIHIMNGCVNPIIYAQRHTTFRRALRRMFGVCCGKKMAIFRWDSVSLKSWRTQRSRFLSRTISTTTTGSAFPLSRLGSKSSNFQAVQRNTSHASTKSSLEASPRGSRLSSGNIKYQHQFLQAPSVGEGEAGTICAVRNPCYRYSQDSDDVFVRQMSNSSGSQSPVSNKTHVRFSNQDSVLELPPITECQLQDGTGEERLVTEAEVGSKIPKTEVSTRHIAQLSPGDEEISSSKLSPKGILKRESSEEEKLMN